MNRKHLAGAAALGAAIAVLISCGGGGASPRRDVSLAVTIDAGGADVDRVVLEVSASDIPTTLVFNLTVQAGVASGTLLVPAGSARTLVARAYHGADVVAEGTATLDVARGPNAPVAMPMVSKAGHLPVTVQLGPISVAVAPVDVALVPGGTAQLAATVRSPDGQKVSTPVAWATDDPSVAVVSEAGLVTAVAAGATYVVATAEGVAAKCTVTVAAP